jgi:hypothetical protein
VVAHNIAKWNGSAWSVLSSGVGGSSYTPICALAVSGPDLYAAGYFGTAGGGAVNNIAKWDGSAWSALGSGIWGPPSGSSFCVYALAVSGPDLYAGGAFTTAGGVAVNGIAKWDGSAWSALGSGMGGYGSVYALTVIGTNLYAGGYTRTAGGVPANNIARWDGSAWSALGSGVNDDVWALAADGLGHLFVGGYFSVAGTNVSPSIAQANVGSAPTSAPPALVASSAGLTVAVGATVDFQVEAIGSPPLVYQWLFNGTTAIAGATSSVLSLTNLQLTQAGAYSATVTNLYGAVTSAPALLQVFPSGIVVTNSEADLRAVMAGGGTVTFACDGTITLASTITIAASTVLDGSGHQVTISGGNAVRVFEVPTNATLALVNLTIANGAAYGADEGTGGAIFNSGTAIVDLCIFTGNLASGADAAEAGVVMGGSGMGGAVYNDGTGTLVVKRSTFSGNRVSGGAGAPVDSGWGGDGMGGAIFNQGTLWLESSTLQDNVASGGAGGSGPNGQPWMDIATDGGQGGEGGTGAGGALYNAGSAIAVNSTFDEDTGRGGGGGAGGTGGSGIYGNGNGGAGGTGGNGFGAVYGAAGGLYLTNCTLAFNWASGGGGGEGGAGGTSGTAGPGYPGPAGSSGVGAGGGISGGFLINTLLATNGGNCSGSVTDGGHNLSSDGTCNFTNIGSMNNTDPKLGPLANNGGPTLTMALLPGSPAIDAGNTSLAPATDQRGFPRPAGLAADIGAFEYGSVMPTVTISRSGANGLNILGSGNPGQPCQLLSSTDMVNWVPIASSPIGSGGTIQFIVNCAPGGACRFYRLVMP